MNKHTTFITTPINDILHDSVRACVGIGSGIEAYPVCDYVMQSVFLKMTGAQEQKMKCICWEMATNDYEYRYEFTKTPLGECSNYIDKNNIYKQLVSQIEQRDSSFDAKSDIDRERFLEETIKEIERIFRKSNLLIWAKRSYVEFEKIVKGIKLDCLLYSDKKGSHLSGKCENCKEYDEKTKKFSCPNAKDLRGMYDLMYKHRNRCAHNTLSYQQNLPTLKTLASADHRFDNYFVRFALLIFIDKIFIKLYNKYIEVLDD